MIKKFKQWLADREQSLSPKQSWIVWVILYFLLLILCAWLFSGTHQTLPFVFY